MAIVIYTYSNPYRLHKEPYWPLIKNAFHLCASQTLANGLCDQYRNDFFEGKLTTITRFINTLYNQWESPTTEINQRAVIDNLILRNVLRTKNNCLFKIYCCFKVV